MLITPYLQIGTILASLYELWQLWVQFTVQAHRNLADGLKCGSFYNLINCQVPGP